jgi:hypothetical protein
MNLNDMFPSRFLKSADFKDDETKIFTITGVRKEVLGQGDEKESKNIVSFAETDKEFILNKTNAVTISKFLTAETDNWTGKRVALHVMDVPMRGEMVQGIRVKTRQPSAQPAPVQAATIDAEDELFADEPAANMNVGRGIPPMKRQPA